MLSRSRPEVIKLFSDLQYQAGGCGHGKAKGASDKAWAWEPVDLIRWFGHVEPSSGAVIYRLLAGGGQGGPSKHGRNWHRKTAVSGSPRQLTLKKGVPGDQMWDLLDQLASYLEGGPLMWMMPLHLHVNQKSDYYMMMMMMMLNSAWNFNSSWKLICWKIETKFLALKLSVVVFIILINFKCMINFRMELTWV